MPARPFLAKLGLNAVGSILLATGPQVDDPNTRLKISDSDPGSYVAAADTDGGDVFLRGQSGGANGGANPRGGDIRIIPGVAGAAGTGRDGRALVEGTIAFTNGTETFLLTLGGTAGNNSLVLANDSIAVNANADNNVIIGRNFGTIPNTVDNSILVMNGGASPAGDDLICIGRPDVASLDDSVFVGRQGQAGVSAVAVGRSASAAGTGSIAIGQSAVAGALTDAVAIGRNAAATVAGEIVLGAAGNHVRVTIPMTTATSTAAMLGFTSSGSTSCS
jgi:hypothetical protein